MVDCVFSGFPKLVVVVGRTMRGPYKRLFPSGKWRKSARAPNDAHLTLVTVPARTQLAACRSYASSLFCGFSA